MSFRSRVEAWRDRHPWGAALLILGVMVFLLATDVPRIADAREALGPRWAAASAAGLGVSLALGLLAAAMFAVARWRPAWRTPVEVVGAVLVAGLFFITHPRTGDDALGSTAELTALVTADVVMAAALLYAAQRVYRRADGTGAADAGELPAP